MRNDELRRIAQIVAEQQRRMRETLESPGVRAFVAQAAEQQRRMRETLESPGVRAFVAQAAEQQRLLREAVQSVAEAGAAMVEAYRAWDEAERRILDLLVPRGWLISPGTSLSEVHELLRVHDEEGLDAVEEALVVALTPARCRQIVEGLCDRPSFAVWRPVLEQALVAHEQRMYALAVPVWLLALDGIVFVELGVDNVFVRVQKKHGLAVRARLAFGNRTRLVDALIAVIRTVAAHLPHGAEPAPGELRRHVIFHGLDPHYGTEKASIQGVLLLEVLHFQLEARIPPGSPDSA
jgi:hypothetical protein